MPLYVYPNITMTILMTISHFYTQIISQCHFHVLIKYTVPSKTLQPLPSLLYVSQISTRIDETVI